MAARRLHLSFALSPYDRIAPLIDGRVTIEGVDIDPILLSPEEVFHRAFGYREFDISEVSLSSHALTTARGDSKYIGIPAFLSRVFRHSGIYIRTDRGITRMEDLRGRTIGLPEYQQTANVWIRGILQDEHGVPPAAIHWRTGGTEQPGRRERVPIKLPPDVDLQQIPDDRTLNDMLLAGELDAILTPREPPCYVQRQPNIGRLFEEYRPVEEDYFRRTGIFPIMHLVAIRRELAEQHPWLPVSLYKALVQAKHVALEELALIGHLATTLPWCVAELEHTRRIMGEDFWPYGLPANRHTLSTFLRYSHEQGLCPRLLAPEDLFAPAVLDLSRI